MARPGIPYETVRTFIDGHLADAGALPSIAAIVAACGGSATTITRFRRRYVEESRGVAVDLPDTLQTSIAAGARTLWQELVDALAARETQLDAEVAARLQEAAESVDQAAERTLLADQRARETRAALEETRATLGTERRTSDALRERLTASESALAKASAAIEALESRVVDDAATLERAEREAGERLAAAREETVRLERQANGRVAALEAAHEQALNEHHARAAGLQQTLNDVQAALDGEQQSLAETRDGLAASERDRAALRARLEASAERVAESLAESERSTGALRDERDRLEQTTAELADARASIKRLEAAVDAARQEIAVRGRDLEELRTGEPGIDRRAGATWCRLGVSTRHGAAQGSLRIGRAKVRRHYGLPRGVPKGIPLVPSLVRL